MWLIIKEIILYLEGHSNLYTHLIHLIHDLLNGPCRLSSTGCTGGNEAGGFLSDHLIIRVHIDIQALRDALDRAEQAHAEQVHSQKRFELAVQGSRDAIFDWDLETDQVWFSPRWLQLLNIREGALGNSIPALLWHVVPEDAERVKVELNAFVESDYEKFDSEFQLVNGNNEAVWVMMQ